MNNLLDYEELEALGYDIGLFLIEYNLLEYKYDILIFLFYMIFR